MQKGSPPRLITSTDAKQIARMPKRRAYLDENAESVGVTLTSANLERINKEMPSGMAAGERYDPIGMNRLNR